ncbi:nitrate- and nitrite sensing domain-containing protein [Plantactinospora siamensis]|uniref:histidine kinase n=1 Tax=Plantactinospora siamensis TaxID=555372 RepID=A0ABV6P606_9ACTN
MLLGRLRIRGKLALLVLVPLLSLAALAVPVVGDRIAAANRAGDLESSVRIANRVGTLVQDLQQERLLSIGYLLGRTSRSQLVQKSATVSDRVADLTAEFDGRLTVRVRSALDNVGRLTDLRSAVLTRQASTDQVMAGFAPVDNGLIDALRLQYDVDTRTTAGRQILALDALLRTDEGVSATATLIVLVVAAKGNPAATERASAAFIASLAALQVTNNRFLSLATPEQFQLAKLEEAAATARSTKDILTVGAADPGAAVGNIPLDTLFPAAASMITLGQFVEKKVAVDVIAEVSGQQRRALTEAYLVAGAALLVLVLVIVLSLLLARTVSRPLTRLTRSADRVARLAETELTRIADEEAESTAPLRLDRVDVRARDEIGDLARAFERVQGTAARLVERQVVSRRNVAQMFGHVGRRTQNLVGRQISLLDRLEHRETDPTRLQHLYRLDHVTSRLRRSASSLVVLSGSTGTDGHTEPASLANIVRLALGEIEDYTRVDVRVEPDILVAPAVVGDLVLALAELMENATSFSPPHTRVSVSGARTAEGARLSLVDHGIGMPEQRMAEENARLTRRERLDLAPTEVLGLFVVGRLARRHGWRVALSPTPGGGVTVDLELAEALLSPGRPDGPAGTATRAIGMSSWPPGAGGPVPGPPTGATVELPPAPTNPAAVTRDLRFRPDRPASPAGPAAPPAERMAGAMPTAGAARPARDTDAARTVRDADAARTEQLVGAPRDAGATRTEQLAGAVAGQPATVDAGSGPDGPATAFSPELVARATRLMAGQSWNAFDLVTGNAAGELDAPAGAAGVGAESPQPEDPQPEGAVPDPRRNGGSPAAARAVRGTASIRAGRPPLRQRVPGTHLPTRSNGARPGTAPAGPAPLGVPGARLGAEPAPTGSSGDPAGDPAAVRALVEQFEDGVRRAQEESVELSPPTDPGVRSGPDDDGPTRLTRRVPGSTLGPTAVRLDRPAPPAAPADPEEARSLITEFESGVARALAEIRSEDRDEEGSPR